MSNIPQTTGFEQPATAITPFFSPIPRHAYTLCAQRRLIPRDIQVLGLLLDYKGREGTIVNPSQDEMGRRLSCSPDTIQRSLKRLESVLLIVKTRLRDCLGKLGKCLYDLAATLALMPRHAARLRGGQWGKNQERGAKTPCRTVAASKTETESVLSKQTTHTGAEPVTSPVVVSLVKDLIKEGVGEPVAKALAEKHSQERVREVIGAAGKAKDRPAWIVAALKGGWSVGQKSAIVEIPRYQAAYRVPKLPGAPKMGQSGASLTIVETPRAILDNFRMWRRGKGKR